MFQCVFALATAAETATIEISASVVITGITPSSFNANQAQKDAFAESIIANLAAEVQAMNVEVTNIVAAAARRRRLQAGNVEVSFTIVIRKRASDYAAGEDATFLSSVQTTLKAAVSDGSLATVLQDEFDDAGFSLTITVDETASLAGLDAATVTLAVTTPAPTAAPTAGKKKKKKSDGDAGGMLIIIVVVVVAVLAAAGAGAFLVMQKKGKGARIEASPHN